MYIIPWSINSLTALEPPDQVNMCDKSQIHESLIPGDSSWSLPAQSFAIQWALWNIPGTGSRLHIISVTKIQKW